MMRIKESEKDWPTLCVALFWAFQMAHRTRAVWLKLVLLPVSLTQNMAWKKYDLPG